MPFKRLISCIAAVVVAIGVAAVPVTAASASSPYDSQTQSALVGLNNAMQYYALMGDGTYNGVTAASLQSYGYSPGASTHLELYVLSNGTQYWADAQDTHSGTQLYAVSTSGAFLGHNGTGVGASSVQPQSPPATVGTTIKTTSQMPDLVAIGAVLAAAAVTAQDVCDTVLVMPGTHRFGSSLSDQYIECISAARTSGSTASLAMQAMLTVGRVGAIVGATAWIVGDGTSAPVKPTWADGTNTTSPSILPPRPSTLPNYWNVPFVASVLQAKNSSLTAAQAQTAADTCLGQAAGALLGDPYSKCESMPIFASGQSDFPEAANHDIAAIRTYPAWTMLNYLPASSQIASRTWYSSYPACATPPIGTSCDEYPFYSSQQGGPNSTPVPDLALISSLQNSGQGGRYGNFVTGCHMSSADGFLSIPIPPQASTVPTLLICNGH